MIKLLVKAVMIGALKIEAIPLKDRDAVQALLDQENAQ